MSLLLEALRKRGWTVRERNGSIPLLPDALKARFPFVPSAVTDFLERIEVCCNADENVWFLTAEDFRKTDEDGFRWNEYELMALEGDEGNRDAQAATRAFWNEHLPIMLAVHSDYDYIAVRVAEPNAGSIVHGFAPEWEEPSPVARSFAVFLESLAAEASSSNPEYPYSAFL